MVSTVTKYITFSKLSGFPKSFHNERKKERKYRMTSLLVYSNLSTLALMYYLVSKVTFIASE